MYQFTVWAAVTAFNVFGVCQAQSHAQLNGMTVFGYQGWYPIDQAPNVSPQDYGPQTNFKWFKPAYVEPGPPAAGQNVLTDPLPYVDAYPEGCRLNTNFVLSNGTNAQFYTSYCDAVIEQHFQWMQEYKIDGIFVQRFFYTVDPSNAYYNATLHVLNTTRVMAERYNKYFAVEYDFSGQPPNWQQSNWEPMLTADWNNHIVPLFSSPSYIYNGSRPVVEMWGVGTNATATYGSIFGEIADFYHAMPQNPFLVMGIPHNWLDYKNASNDPTGFWEAYQKADSLQPWPVGAFNNVNELQQAYQYELLPGKQQADAWNITYSGAFTPGGSNRNSRITANYTPSLGNRYNGTFYLEELKLFTNESIVPWFNFGAMFDEYTEGTQILPMLQDSLLPNNSNPGFFGTDNDLDIFYYMNVSGQYTAALHELWGQQPLSP